jgi:hypothetical protein
MTAAKEKVLDKVQKLLAKAESSKQLGSLEEANAFVAKANEIMLEHNLSMVEVNLKDKESGLSSSTVSYLDNMAGNAWRTKLLALLCHYNFCVSVVTAANKTVTVYGDKENVDVVMFLYSNVSARIYNLGVSEYLSIPKEIRPHKRYNFLKNFALGAVTGLNRKLAEVRAAQEANNNKVTALVLNSKDGIIRKLKETIELSDKAYKSKATINPNSRAYQSGREKGYGMDLQGGVGAKKAAGELE